MALFFGLASRNIVDGAHDVQEGLKKQSSSVSAGRYEPIIHTVPVPYGPL